MGLITTVLSNGPPQILSSTLKQVGVDNLIDGIYSTELIRSYKPSPAVYEYMGEQLAIPRSKICFISSNSWDIAGASACGFNSIWVNRYGHVSERLSYKPNLVVKSLSELTTVV